MNSEQVLRLKDVSELRTLRPSWFEYQPLNDAAIKHILGLCGALWLHSGNPADPHAELTSGDHSNGFVDTLRMLRYANLCQIFGQQLAHEIRPGYLGPIDWVIGSDHASADFSHSVAIWLNAQHDFTEKGPDKTQLWRRFAIQPDEVVLQVEELITTTSILQEVRQGIISGNAPLAVTFAPVIGTLVHRSKAYDYDGVPIVSLIHLDIETWKPDKCPLCQKGSRALRPKTHWVELTGRR